MRNFSSARLFSLIKYTSISILLLGIIISGVMYYSANSGYSGKLYDCENSSNGGKARCERVASSTVESEKQGAYFVLILASIPFVITFTLRGIFLYTFPKK